MLVNSSEKDHAMVMQEALRRAVKNLPDQDLLKRSMIIRNFLGQTKMGLARNVFVSEDQGLMCVDTKVSSPWQVLHGHEQAVEFPQ